MAKTKNKMMGKNLDDSRVPVPVTDDDWRAKNDMETLRSSAEIIADPKRHKAAKEMAKKRAKMYQKICK